MTVGIWQGWKYIVWMLQQVETLVRKHPSLVILTGAGLSSPSGIPTYRNDQGEWQRSDPIQHQQFVGDEYQRRRYWARSLAGWKYVADALPNAAHEALVSLERLGHAQTLVTQNVDRLHQRAGHRNVIDLHGRIDRVVCRSCNASFERSDLQFELERLNPGFNGHSGEARPDGDAEVVENRLEDFQVPGCVECDGMLMPDVVFFGGSVPKSRIARVSEAIDQSDALLVAGSSLMVYSGFRFCRQAHEQGKPLLILNRGCTRADELATLKVEGDCAELLPALARKLALH